MVAWEWMHHRELLPLERWRQPLTVRLTRYSARIVVSLMRSFSTNLALLAWPGGDLLDRR
jgi:hypothetical protein